MPGVLGRDVGRLEDGRIGGRRDASARGVSGRDEGRLGGKKSARTSPSIISLSPDDGKSVTAVWGGEMRQL